MKSNLDHLSQHKQKQILQIVEIIKEVAVPEMIILFGSYAKGKQVEHRYTGKDGTKYEYISDYDFLVVTKTNNIKEYELEDIINNRTERFEPSINVQVHEIDYVNEGLEFGQYFFTDIIKEGILLYDTGKMSFTEPRVLTPKEEKEKAQRYFDIWFPSGTGFLNSVEFNLNAGEYKIAAFELHQATESLYYTALLVFTGYKPKTHNLLKLRKYAKFISEELFLVFPIETSKNENLLFDLLKRGYIDARYKPAYSITKEQLVLLIEKVKKIKEIVRQICKHKIESV
jgi:HEPN domain-containing protein/predicted nucleotidyltransferase